MTADGGVFSLLRPTYCSADPCRAYHPNVPSCRTRCAAGGRLKRLVGLNEGRGWYPNLAFGGRGWYPNFTSAVFRFLLRTWTSFLASHFYRRGWRRFGLRRPTFWVSCAGLGVAEKRVVSTASAFTRLLALVIALLAEANEPFCLAAMTRPP